MFILQQRNYYQKYKTYYTAAACFAVFGISTSVYYVSKVLYYMYKRKISNENEIKNIKKHWILKINRFFNVVLNLTMLDLKLIPVLVELLSKISETFSTPNKIRFIIVLNIEDDIYDEFIKKSNNLNENYEEDNKFKSNFSNIIIIKVSLNDVTELDNLSKYNSYLCINLCYSIALSQIKIGEINYNHLNRKIIINNLTLNRVCNNFNKNFKKSAIISIERSNILDLFGIMDHVDSMLFNKFYNFNRNFMNTLESDNRLKIIFTNWNILKIEFPFNNLLNKILDIRKLSFLNKEKKDSSVANKKSNELSNQNNKLNLDINKNEDKETNIESASLYKNSNKNNIQEDNNIYIPIDEDNEEENINLIKMITNNVSFIIIKYLDDPNIIK